MLLQMARFHSFYGWVIFHYVYHIYHIFFICSSINGHIGCFPISAIVNKAVVNIGVQISFFELVWGFFFFFQINTAGFVG